LLKSTDPEARFDENSCSSLFLSLTKTYITLAAYSNYIKIDSADMRMQLPYYLPILDQRITKMTEITKITDLDGRNSRTSEYPYSGIASERQLNVLRLMFQSEEMCATAGTLIFNLRYMGTEDKFRTLRMVSGDIRRDQQP